MEAAELKFLNVLIEKLHLTDEEKIDFVEDFEKVRESRLNSSMGEIKSLLKDYFHALELKMEQNKSDIDLKFEQFDRKLDQNNFDIDLKFEQQNTKLEHFKAELNSKIGDTKDKLTNLFITGFITVVVMILGLFATIVFKFLV